MKISPIKTAKIKCSSDIFKTLEQFLPQLEENSIVVIASKIISLCEGRVLKKDGADKKELIQQEADYWLPAAESAFGVTLTIKRSSLQPTAGIDVSNADGHYVLWPRDPQATANTIREHLQKHFSLSQLGVIITDSKSSPLRRGVTGVGLAHSGFSALNRYRDRQDVFGHKKGTVVNVLDSLATAAVLTMGETDEQTPLAIIQDIPFVRFQRENPTAEELSSFYMKIEGDLFAPILKKADWRKGDSGLA